MRRCWVAIVVGVLALAAAHAEVVDSVVAVVGTKAIKHSDVILDARITEFLNQMPVDLSAKQQEDAMNRLIDQAVIRTELLAGSYSLADAAQVDAAMKPIRDGYGGQDNFRKALQGHGITEDQLRDHVQWEITAIDFIQLRFGSAQTAPAAGDSKSDAGQNDSFISWLDAARKNERIVTKPERLK